MLPQLLPTPSRRLAPPADFHPLVGRPEAVRVSHSGLYQRGVGQSVAQKSGLRYEEKVQRALLAHYNIAEDVETPYHAGSYIHFRDDSGYRTCLPDGLLDLQSILYIIEIKIAHMARAWWQLERLYRPLIQRYSPRREIRVCEIVRSYDPSVAFPVDVTRLESLDDLSSLQKSDFGVLVWNP